MPREDEGCAMDVAFLTIAELNRLYRQRELSPVEVTKALLARIAAHDGKLHSFLRMTEEVALREAAEKNPWGGASRRRRQISTPSWGGRGRWLGGGGRKPGGS